MSWILGIIGLAIFIGLYVAITNLWDAGWRTLNRKIFFRAKYERAINEFRDPAVFITRIPPREAVHAVRDDLRMRPSEGLLRVGVSVEELGVSVEGGRAPGDSDVSLLLRIGNLFTQHYTCVLSAWLRPEATHVHLEVVQWKEMDGIPARTDLFYQLKDDVGAALRRRDADARVGSPMVGAGSRGRNTIGHPAAPLGSLRVCVEQSCDLRDQPTQRLRCPHCDGFTQLRESAPSGSGAMEGGTAGLAAAAHHSSAMPLGSLRACIQLSCDLRDEPTQSLRCPQCEQFTQLR